MITLLSATVATLCLFFGCAPDNSGAFTDARDGKRYKTVKMPNGKTWMAENLNYQTPSGSWCHGDYEHRCNRYGRLYNRETAAFVCPDGWHLPYADEWDDMIGSLGWHAAGYALKAKSGWITEKYQDNGNGIDLYGFSALPGGIFIDDESYGGWYKPRTSGAKVSVFRKVGETGYWWMVAGRYRYYRHDAMSNAMSISNSVRWAVMTNYTRNENGLSVRCVRDYIDPSELARLMAEAKQGQKEAERRQNEAEEQRQKDTEERIARGSGRFTDPRDGQTYRTMVIGGETWMAQNLNYRTRGGSWCYDNKNSNCDTYGRLYDWNTAMAACPPGWHLSTREEWKRLVKTVDGAGNFGPSERAGKKLKAESGWKNRWGDGRDGTDEYGFAALPGGYREFEIEENPYWINIQYSTNIIYPFPRKIKKLAFRSDNNGGSWWTATEGAYGSAFSRYIRGNRDHVAEFNDVKDYGFSARCVQDK